MRANTIHYGIEGDKEKLAARAFHVLSAFAAPSIDFYKQYKPATYSESKEGERFGFMFGDHMDDCYSYFRTAQEPITHSFGISCDGCNSLLISCKGDDMTLYLSENELKYLECFAEQLSKDWQEYQGTNETDVNGVAQRR